MTLFDAYGSEIVEALREQQATPTLAGNRNIYSVIDDSVGLTPEKAIGILRTADSQNGRDAARYRGDRRAITANRSTMPSVCEVSIASTLVELHDVVFEMLDSLAKGVSATENPLGHQSCYNPLTSINSNLPTD